MKKPWEAPIYRFGFALGERVGTSNDRALGWAVVRLKPPPILAEGEVETPDPIQAMIDRYHALEAEFGPSNGIDLYEYNSSNFHLSRAFASGATLKQYRAMLRDAAARLRAANIPFKIKKAVIR